MSTDIEAIIKSAKLGGARKEAQDDACEPFAAALFDVLTQVGIKASVACATFRINGASTPSWFHAIVEVDGVYYDSLGKFDHDIVRARSRIHKTVKTDLEFKPDVRYFDEQDWTEMHSFCVKKLSVAARKTLNIK